MTPERYRRICETLDRRQPDLTVIMDGVHKPHNIAAIVRTCGRGRNSRCACSVTQKPGAYGRRHSDGITALGTGTQA